MAKFDIYLNNTIKLPLIAAIIANKTRNNSSLIVLGVFNLFIIHGYLIYWIILLNQGMHNTINFWKPLKDKR